MAVGVWLRHSLTLWQKADDDAYSSTDNNVNTNINTNTGTNNNNNNNNKEYNQKMVPIINN
jgi:hypothetical protein